jgi:carboxypeptidase Taq
MSNLDDQYSALVTELKHKELLASCSSLLHWDEQTYIPPKGAEHRSEQSALLAGLVHERGTSPRLGELLAGLREVETSEGSDSPRAAVVREAQRNFERATRLPRRLVEDISRTTALAQHAWVEARKRKDFFHFLPWLEKTVALKREEAEAVGYGEGVPYDALLDEYEPGATAAWIQSVFGPLRTELVQLVAAIRESGRELPVEIVTRRYPVEAQREFSLRAAAAIGFDLDSGRLDVAAHPFCSGIGPGDCRLTTRYDEHHFPCAFFGTLHEAGHGIYEQGLAREHYGTALGQTASLGIHESQSRMWENFVGRSRAFWQHFYPAARQAFPEALSGVAAEDFYAAINDVRPSWIRVEADEVTYNLHIMLRFELEQPLISGDLAPGDVPDVWNETFHRYFGMTPPDDALGCLQDIHWSIGGIGYFPTYTLGNLYAALFCEQADRDLGGLSALFARGEFDPLKLWLNEKIHRRGLHYRAARLVQVVTGKPLTADALLRHLRGKFGPLYGLAVR